MTSYIEPLMQQSTPSIIADKLRHAIGHGELKPGAQLTQEGLLVSIRNRGLFVIQMTPQDVRDMYLAREAIERAAAHKILEGDYVAAADALLEIVEQMSAATTPAEVSELDIAFHERLVKLADSPRLTRIHRTFITETRMCIHALDESYSASEVRGDEHRAVATAIRSGDLKLADELLIAHMDDAIRRLIATDATGDCA
jgi:DNA-binding GntR family transcriptional regulator